MEETLHFQLRTKVNRSVALTPYRCYLQLLTLTCAGMSRGLLGRQLSQHTNGAGGFGGLLLLLWPKPCRLSPIFEGQGHIQGEIFARGW